MNDVKIPMSNSYKAVFIFSIFMIFFVTIMGAASGSKGGSGFGVFVWGYTAWLMYKRNNKDLIYLYKFLLWIEGIGCSIVAAIFTFSESEIISTVEIVGLFVTAAITMGMSYGLYKFFQRQHELS